MSKQRRPKFDTVDEEDFEVSRPKSKRPTKKTSKKVAAFSDSESETEHQSDEEVEEKRPTKKAGRPKKQQAREVDSPKSYEDEDEKAPAIQESEFGHPCSGCQNDFDCKDGKQKTVRGKSLFKCSCVKMKHEQGTAYFCSKKCKKAAEESEEVSDGYETA